MAVGPGKIAEDGVTSIPLTVKAGDLVLLPPMKGTPIRVDDQEHVVVSEDEILAVFEP